MQKQINICSNSTSGIDRCTNLYIHGSTATDQNPDEGCSFESNSLTGSQCRGFSTGVMWVHLREPITCAKLVQSLQSSQVTFGNPDIVN